MIRSRAGAALVALVLSWSCRSTSDPIDEDARTPLAKDAVEASDAGALDEGGADAGAEDAQAPDAAPVLSDRDRDGLPDDDDPDPDRANALLFGDTFERTDPAWLFTSVGMEIDTGASLLRVPQVEPFVRVGWLGPRAQWADLYIRALVRVTRVGQSGEAGTGRLGIMARTLQVSPARYLLCGLDAKRGEVFVSEHIGGNPVGTTLAMEPTPFRANTWLRLTFETDSTSIRCTVDGVRAVARYNGALTTGSSGFRAFDVAFDADWIEIYDR